MTNAVPVTMYSTQFCPYCTRAKKLLQTKGVDFTEVRVDSDPKQRQLMMDRSGRRTVPQIWVGETHVGGFDELWRLDQSGELETLLAQ